MRFVTVVVAALALAGAAHAGGPTAHSADKNSSDFSNQAEAQHYFDANGGSPSNNVDGLDRDHDGTACDSNPCSYAEAK